MKVPEVLGDIDIAKSNWHILIDEAMGFKQSAFFKMKGGIIQNMCKYMHAEKEHGHSIRILHQDNARKCGTDQDSQGNNSGHPGCPMLINKTVTAYSKLYIKITIQRKNSI
jgi:hypothetical protein